MKKLLWLYICCLGILLKTNAANTDSLLYFENLIFNAENTAEKNNFIYYKYLFLKSTGNFYDGIKTLNRINTLTTAEEADITYEKAILNYLIKDYSAFEFELTKLERLSLPENKIKITALQLLKLINVADFKQAKLKCDTFFALNNITINTDSIFKPFIGKKFKSEQRAALLSTFLPGTGQWYAGNFKHGIINATLILGLLGWGTYNVLHAYYATGLFTGFFIAYTFYEGGSRYAVNATERYNKKLTEEARNRVLFTIVKFIR